jgi:hypothetical protein
MNMAPLSRAGVGTPRMEFDGLERFPCGCIALVEHTRPWPVTVISIEAKGPHCILPAHSAGRVVRLGDGWDSMGEEDEAG